MSRTVLEGRGSPGSGSPAQPRSAAPGSQRQPEAARAGKGGLSSFHGSNRKTRDCTTWKNSTHTHAHTPRHTPHTPGTTANMFRPSAGRDTRQRRAVQISRGSLVLVDSPRKKQPPEVVVAQLCKICGVFSVWQLQEGKQGVYRVCYRRGKEWKYSAVFPGVLLALQPVRAWRAGRGRRVPERTTNPSDVTPTRRQGRPTLAQTEQLAAQKR